MALLQHSIRFSNIITALYKQQTTFEPLRIKTEEIHKLKGVPEQSKWPSSSIQSVSPTSLPRYTNNKPRLSNFESKQKKFTSQRMYLSNLNGPPPAFNQILEHHYSAIQTTNHV